MVFTVETVTMKSKAETFWKVWLSKLCKENLKRSEILVDKNKKGSTRTSSNHFTIPEYEYWAETRRRGNSFDRKKEKIHVYIQDDGHVMDGKKGGWNVWIRIVPSSSSHFYIRDRIRWETPTNDSG